MDGSEYIAGLKKLQRKVYIQGQLAPAPMDHPLVRPSTNAVARTYELQQETEYEELIYAQSHLSGAPLTALPISTVRQTTWLRR